MGYKVQSGDSWSRIASRVYGDSRMMGELMRANPDIFHLHPGMELRIPKKKKDPYLSESELFRQPYAGGPGYGRSGELNTKNANTLPGLEAHLPSVMDVLRTSEEQQEVSPAAAPPQSLQNPVQQTVTVPPEVQNIIDYMREEGVQDEHLTPSNAIALAELSQGGFPNAQEDYYRFLRRIAPAESETMMFDGFGADVVRRAEERAAQQRMEQLQRQRDNPTPPTTTMEKLAAATNSVSTWLGGNASPEFGESVGGTYNSYNRTLSRREQRELERAEAREYNNANVYYVENEFGSPLAFVPGSQNETLGQAMVQDIAPMMDVPPNAVGSFLNQMPAARFFLSGIRAGWNGAAHLVWNKLRQISDFGSRNSEDAPYAQSNGIQDLAYTYFDSETGLVAPRSEREQLEQAGRLVRQPRAYKTFGYLEEAVADAKEAWHEFWNDPLQIDRRSVIMENDSVRAMVESYVEGGMRQDMAEQVAMSYYQETKRAEMHNEAARLRVQARTYIQYIQETNGATGNMRTEEVQHIDRSTGEVIQTTQRSMGDITQEQVQQREEFYTMSREMIYEAVLLDIEAFDALSPAFAFTWQGSPERYEAYINACVDLEMQIGRPLTERDYRLLKDHFVDPVAEIAGQIFLDPFNWVSFDFFTAPLKEMTKKGLSWAARGIRATLENIVEHSADDLFLRILSAPSKVALFIGDSITTQARASAISQLTNGGQSSLLVGTRSVDRILGDAGTGTLGDTVDAIVSGVRAMDGEGVALTARGLREGTESIARIPFALRDTHLQRIRNLMEAVKITPGMREAAAKALKRVEPENWGTIISDISQSMYQKKIKELTELYISQGMKDGVASRAAQTEAFKWLSTQKNEIMRTFTDTLRQALRASNSHYGSGLMRDSIMFNLLGEEFLDKHKNTSRMIKGINTASAAVRNLWVESVLSFNPRWAMRNWVDSSFRFVVSGDNPFSSLSGVLTQLQDLSRGLAGIAADLGMEGMAESGETFQRGALSSADKIFNRMIAGDYEGISPAILPLRLMADEFHRLRGEGVRNPLSLMYKSWTGGWGDFNSAIEFSLRARMLHTKFFDAFDILEVQARDSLVKSLREMGAPEDTIQKALAIYQRAGTDTDKMVQLLESLQGGMTVGRRIESIYISEAVQKSLAGLTPAERHIFLAPIQKQIDDLLAQGLARNESPEIIINNLFDSLIKIIDDDSGFDEIAQYGNLREIRYDLTGAAARSASEAEVMGAGELITKEVIEETEEQVAEEVQEELTSAGVKTLQAELEELGEGYTELLSETFDVRVEEVILKRLDAISDTVDDVETVKQSLMRLTSDYRAGVLSDDEYVKEVKSQLSEFYNAAQKGQKKYIQDIVSTNRRLLGVPVVSEDEVVRLLSEADEEVAEEVTDELVSFLTEGMSKEEAAEASEHISSRVRQAGSELNDSHGKLTSFQQENFIVQTQELQRQAEQFSQLADKTDEMKLAEAHLNQEIIQRNRLALEINSYVESATNFRTRLRDAIKERLNPMDRSGSDKGHYWDIFHTVMSRIYKDQSDRANHILGQLMKWQFNPDLSVQDFNKYLDRVFPGIRIGDVLDASGIEVRLRDDGNIGAFIIKGESGTPHVVNTTFSVNRFMEDIAGQGNIPRNTGDLLDYGFDRRYSGQIRKERIPMELRPSENVITTASANAVADIIHTTLPPSKLQALKDEATRIMDNRFPGLGDGRGSPIGQWIDEDDSKRILSRLLTGEITEDEALGFTDTYTEAMFCLYAGKDVTNMSLEELTAGSKEGLRKYIDDILESPDVRQAVTFSIAPMEELDQIIQESMRIEVNTMLNELDDLTLSQIKHLQWWNVIKGTSHRSHSEHADLFRSVAKHIQDGTVPEGRRELNAYNRLREYLAESMRVGSFADDGNLIRPPNPYFWRLLGEDEAADAMDVMWRKEFGHAVSPETLARNNVETNFLKFQEEMWNGYVQSSPAFERLRSLVPDNVLKTPESLADWLEEILVTLEDGPLRDTYVVFMEEINRFNNLVSEQTGIQGIGRSIPSPRMMLMTPWNINMQPAPWLQWLSSTVNMDVKRRIFKETLEQWRTDLLEELTSGTFRTVSESEYKMISDALMSTGVDMKNRSIEYAMYGSGDEVVEGLGRLGGALPETQYAMIDYSDYSQMDQAIRNIYPFWLFSRSSIPYWMDVITERPQLLAYYERYMMFSRRMAVQEGAVTSRGDVLPKMNGYIPIPGTDMWVDLTAGLSMRYIMPDRRMYWHEDQTMTIMQKIVMQLYDTGNYFGLSMPPWITIPMLATGLLDSNVIPTDSLIPQGDLIPKWANVWVEEAMERSELGRVIGKGYKALFNPDKPWEDFEIEQEILKMALEWISDGADPDEVASRVQAALGYENNINPYIEEHPEWTPQSQYTLNPRRDNSDWREAESRVGQRSYSQTLAGFFTGVYPKAFSDADAQIIQIRTNINMLRSNLNNEVGTEIFQLAPDIEDRWRFYLNAKYDTPEGWISNMYGTMRWVRTPEGGTPDPRTRREIMAQLIHEENATNAMYEAKQVATQQLEYRLANLDIGDPPDLYWRAYESFFADLAAIEAHPYYEAAYRSNFSGYKPRELIEGEMRDLFYRMLRQSIPRFQEYESYDEYQLVRKRWEEELPTLARILADKFKINIMDYATGGRGLTYDAFMSGTVENLLGQTLDVDKFIASLYKNLDLESFQEWERSNDTILDALNNAWKELYWNPYWNSLEGLSGRERQIAEREFLAQHPTPPTPVELAGWIMEIYGDRWTLEQIVGQATLPDRQIRTIEERTGPMEERQRLEDEVWTRLSSVPPSSTKQLVDYMVAYGGADMEDALDVWYATGGSSESWKDQDKFLTFVEALIQSTEALGFQEPTTEQLQEWSQAQQLNDRFRDMISSSLGDNFFDTLSLYYRLSDSERRREYKRNPDIKTYYQLRDIFGENFQLWARYYHEDVYHDGATVPVSGSAVDVIGSSVILPQGLGPAMGADLTEEIELMLEQGEPISEEGQELLGYLAGRKAEWKDFIDAILQANDELY